MLHRVEVCGGIASGKTTLTGLFPADAFFLVFENFQTNPFWQAFYEDPNSYSFETEVTFLLQHYHQIIAARADGKIVVTDYSFVLDRAYVDVTLQGSAKEAFLSVYDEVMNRLSPPSLLIHLTCESGVELERIRGRGRNVEQSITEDYLASLNQAVSRHAGEYSSKTKVLKIDSAVRDFAHDPQEQQRVLSDVSQMLELPA